MNKYILYITLAGMLTLQGCIKYEEISVNCFDKPFQPTMDSYDYSVNLGDTKVFRASNSLQYEPGTIYSWYSPDGELLKKKHLAIGNRFVCRTNNKWYVLGNRIATRQ